jgi:Rrf2 family iron-sulfur cluster assembly transcriptional regulator
MALPEYWKLWCCEWSPAIDSDTFNSGELKVRIGSKGRFAVNAMIDIALREDFGPVSLTDVALRQHISLSSLEQLFSKLRLHGLVTSIRGPGGGYTLGRPSDGITAADIICAVEEAPAKQERTNASPAQELTQDLWEALNAKVLNFTQSVTLKSLVVGQLAKGITIEQKPLSNRGVFKKPMQQSTCSNIPNSVFALGRILRAGG